ncbi:CapA family protein [Micrococcoides hystricis]|uniref:CapA family protein n=1 Tax=Micrococcoides hystricis TaxID=1572761 RepID=A0ABV6PBW9_9MICC
MRRTSAAQPSQIRRILGMLAATLLLVSTVGCGVVAEEKPIPTASASETTESPRSATIVLSGDLLWHPSLYRGAEQDAANAGDQGYDFAPLFEDVKPLIQEADLAICHEEVPFAPPGEEPSGYPAFGAPDAVAEGVSAVGWDMCTTASNHSLDRGMEGLRHTVESFEAAGVDVVGTYTGAADAKTPYIFTTEEGVKVSVVIGTYGLNGYTTPPGEEYAVDLLDVPAMISKAEAAKEDGADIVLAAVHAGDEYETMPNQQQIDAATALADSPAIDMIYGHHVHVVQPWDRINGKLVIYGLGNMVAQHMTDEPRGYEGVTAEIRFTEDEDGSFSLDQAAYYPTLVTRSGLLSEDGAPPARLLQVNKALENGHYIADADQERLELARSRTAEAVNALQITDIIEK